MEIPELATAASQFWNPIRARLFETKGYQIIKEHFAGQIATRSALPYINHIHEGIYILNRCFGWDETTAEAFCVHPIFQDVSDDSHATQARCKSELNHRVTDLASQYAKAANAYTSKHRLLEIAAIPLPSDSAVRQMLVADKVQNKKDFVAQVLNPSTANSNSQGNAQLNAHLMSYFDRWLDRLGVTPTNFTELATELQDVFASTPNEQK